MKRIMDRLRYRGPDINAEGVVIDRFTVGGPNETFGAFLASLEYESQGRGCAPGEYAKLVVDGTLWMSDTTAECRDHREPVGMADMAGGDALVNGLGMGCVVAA